MDETRLAQLRDFIIEGREQGETYDVIRQQLLTSGWTDADVDEYLPTAWQQAEAAAAPVVPVAAVPPAMPPSMAPAMPPGVPPVMPPGIPPQTPEEPAYPPSAEEATPVAYPPKEQPGFGGTPLPPPVGMPLTAEPPAYGIGAWISRGWAMFSSDAGTMIGAFIVTGLLGVVTAGICLPPLLAGFNRLLLKKHDGQPIAVGDIFEGFRYFWSAWGVFALMMIASFIVSIPASILTGGGHHEAGQAMSGGMVAANGITTIWGWIVGTFFLFAMPFVADGRGGAIEAVTASFEAAKSDFGMYLVMVIVSQLLAVAGIILCIVGIFATGPWSQATLVSVYRSRFPAR